LAGPFFSEQERVYFEKGLAESLEFFDPERAAACPDQATALAWYMRIQGGPVTLSRSRYTEDTLASAIARGAEQYVILGAGMDTFAFRHPELMQHLHLFEVDQQETQTFKRERLASREPVPRRFKSSWNTTREPQIAGSGCPSRE
jgi:methyltransferase (TIGR00027 family)